MTRQAREYYGFVASSEQYDDAYGVSFDAVLAEKVVSIDPNETRADDIRKFLREYSPEFISVKLTSNDFEGQHFYRRNIVNKGQWFSFALNEAGGEGIDATYSNGYSAEAGRQVRISRLKYMHNFNRTVIKLRRIYSLRWFLPADERPVMRRIDALMGQIDELLRQSQERSFVACYNVGQGTCCALCVPGNIPIAYFDFGGTKGALRSPTGFRPCLTFNPTILLTHWDEDHWIAGTQEPQAQHCYWIAPFQRNVKPSALTFAAALAYNNRLILWPAGWAHRTYTWGTIIKLPDSPRTNLSGLAFVVTPQAYQTGGAVQDVVLLPGDAGYGRIRNHWDISNINCLVAAHHGGYYEVSNRLPIAPQDHIIAYSHGGGPHHPSPRAIPIYNRRHWTNRYDTHIGQPPISGGNIAVTLNPPQSRAVPCGGARCALELPQP